MLNNVRQLWKIYLENLIEVKWILLSNFL